MLLGQGMKLLNSCSISQGRRFSVQLAVFSFVRLDFMRPKLYFPRSFVENTSAHPTTWKVKKKAFPGLSR